MSKPMFSRRIYTKRFGSKRLSIFHTGDSEDPDHGAIFRISTVGDKTSNREITELELKTFLNAMGINDVGFRHDLVNKLLN